jgi:hypothetical protein
VAYSEHVNTTKKATTTRSAQRALNDATRQLSQAMESINHAAEHIGDGSLGARLVKNCTDRQIADWLRGIEAAVARLRTAAGVNGGLKRAVWGIDGKHYPRGRYNPEDIEALRESGLSMRAIADKLGCSVGTVHRHLS